MTLRIRLLLLIAAVAALPLLLSAWLALRVHHQAFERQVEETQQVEARGAARLAQARLDAVVRTFQLLGGQVEWPRLTAAEREGALWLAYRQSDDAAAVVLIDEAGKVMVDPVYAAVEGAPAGDPSHPAIPYATLTTLAASFPVAQARAGSARWAMGAPLSAGEMRPALVPLALGIAGRGASGGWTLGIGLSLRGLCEELSRGAEATELLLVEQQADGHDRFLCAGRSAPSLSPLDPALAAAARVEGRSVTYRAPGGDDYRLASARMASTGWRVVARRPADVALAPGRRIRNQSIIGLLVALVLALGAGLVLAQAITRRVQRLVQGTSAIAEGRLDHRLDEGGDDELAHLAQSFNRMSQEVQKRDDEIRAWNEELQQRVASRTRELRDAQEQILRSDKLAAVNALGAGLGGEILPSLTTITSFTQMLLKRREKEGTSNDVLFLSSIDEAAQRIAGVVDGLQLLSSRFADSDHVPLGVPALLEEALMPLEDRMGAVGIQPARFYEDMAPRILGSADELRRAFREIYKNAVTTMSEGGKLTISVRSLEGRAVVVTIADTGRGIPPEHLDKIFDAFFSTRVDERSAGLGLSIVHDVITRHHGRVQVESTPGTGTTVKVTLPALIEARDA